MTLSSPKLKAAQLGGLWALTDEALYEACGVRVAFASRLGGVSTGEFAQLNCAPYVGDDQQAVKRNHELVLGAVGASADTTLVVPTQVHGTDVVEVGADASVGDAMAQAAAGADIVVVRQSGVAALINTADCAAVAVVAPSGSYALLHAGWRGVVAGVAGIAVRILAGANAGDARAFNVYIGPHIRSECFEVGPEVAQQFSQAFGNEVLADERHVDLARALAIDLQRAGVDSSRIADCGVCTKCNYDRYYSYRATNGHCGRHALIGYRYDDSTA